jgi:glycosyltransferase involved in cell wall biosynthesis
MTAPRVAPAEITVAHFRRWIFGLTETFLYNVIRASERSLPICFAIQRENTEAFPLDTPVLELYSWNSGAVRLRRISGRFLRIRRHRAPLFDHPRTYRGLRKYRVSLLHAHFGYTGVELLPVQRRTRLPLVTTFYGHDISIFPKTEEWREKYDNLFRRGDLFLAEGPFMRDRLHDLGCPPEKTAVVPIGIRLDRYRFRPRSGDRSGRPAKLFFCGRFREKKGLIHALAAVRRVRDGQHDFEFHVVGDGELRPLIEAYISENKMASYTILHGSQNHARVIEELDSADILIAPSVVGSDGDSEGGAPTILLEAQACGVPIVASTHADIPNVVAPGESALLSQEGDHQGLANHLEELLREPERWPAMGEAGRRFVERNHDVRLVVQQLESLYLELAAKSERPGSEVSR